MTDAPRPDLTAADWAAMRARVNAATPGPWRESQADGDDDIQGGIDGSVHVVCMGHDYDEYGTYESTADKVFIAHARTDLPLALDALARQQEANARLTEAKSHATCHDMECNTGPTLPRGVLGCSCQGRVDRLDLLRRLAIEQVDRALAERDATVKQAHEAHAASFGALATISAALFDGEVDDYDALAQRVINLVADRDATIARLREAQTWQPMETAPKDGTGIIGWFGEYDAPQDSYDMIVWMHDIAFGPDRAVDRGWCYANSWTPIGRTPTCWRPLPMPPAATEE